MPAQKTAKGLGLPGNLENRHPSYEFRPKASKGIFIAAAGSCKTPMRKFPGSLSNGISTPAWVHTGGGTFPRVQDGRGALLRETEEKSNRRL